MSAPNIATLYDFEGNYEDPIANYIANVNVGGMGLAQVVTPRTNLTAENFLRTPRFQVKVSMIGPAPSGSGLQETPVTVANVTSNYYSYYAATVTLDAVTNRSWSNQPHGLYRGAGRQAMLEITASMNANTVPYYQTALVTPQGSIQSIDADNDEIITQMAFLLEFYIPPTSFPNS